MIKILLAKAELVSTIILPESFPLGAHNPQAGVPFKQQIRLELEHGSLSMTQLTIVAKIFCMEMVFT
ncbi:hypothetical protein [Aeromonas veronii]|uniref:hypothetical protein n=1 Tax=Aeromonas veronii TaxID=654 RepID=UPI00244485C3|nr:hypothetical protein [Aeromonas veronii]